MIDHALRCGSQYKEADCAHIQLNRVEWVAIVMPRVAWLQI
jgi:hypothetical protein